MATIKQMIGRDKAESLYAFKDRLKESRILQQNPMRLNRTQFEKYLAAKAEQLITEYTADGVDVDDAFRKAELYLVVTDAQWRDEAKRLNESLLATVVNEVEKITHG